MLLHGTSIGRKSFYMVGDSITYKCPMGYKLIYNKDEKRTCLSNGRWSGNAPTCKYIECGEIPSGALII